MLEYYYFINSLLIQSLCSMIYTSHYLYEHARKISCSLFIICDFYFYFGVNLFTFIYSTTLLYFAIENNMFLCESFAFLFNIYMSYSSIALACTCNANY